MDNKLYKLMDWPAIEEIVYSESSQPCSILGGHLVKEGYLIQVFRPDAVSVSVSVSERKRLSLALMVLERVQQFLLYVVSFTRIVEVWRLME